MLEVARARKLDPLRIRFMWGWFEGEFDDLRWSPDSKWLAYGIAISESEEAKLRKAKKPLHRGMGLRNLPSGEALTFDAMLSCVSMTPLGSPVVPLV